MYNGWPLCQLDVNNVFMQQLQASYTSNSPIMFVNYERPFMACIKLLGPGILSFELSSKPTTSSSPDLIALSLLIFEIVYHYIFLHM